MRAVLTDSRSRRRRCPLCGAPAARFLVEELTLFETLFEGEAYEIEACTCGWTRRLPDTEAA